MGTRRLSPILGLVVASLAVYPLFSGPYAVDLMTQALLFAVLAISLDMLWGFAGILNLAPAASFGLGAYAFALSQRHLPVMWSGIVGLGLSIAVPVLLAVVVSYSSFKARSTHIYFALITLAVGLGLEKVATVWYGVTGGSNGLAGIIRPSFWGLDISNYVSYYYFVGIVVGGIFWLSHRLVRSPLGRVLTAIRENELRAQAVGYNTTLYKVVISAVCAGMGGIAGALTTPLTSIAHPSQFSVQLSMQVFVWVAVGGSGNLTGPFLAAVGIKLLESWLSGLLAWTYLLVIGLIFVVVVLFFPTGLAGTWQTWRDRRNQQAIPVESQFVEEEVTAAATAAGKDRRRSDPRGGAAS